MKLEKYLLWIEKTLLNYPDIDFPTIHMFIDKLHYYMSKKEREQFSIHIQVIKSLTSKQISIDTFIHKTKIDNLESELHKIKKGN